MENRCGGRCEECSINQRTYCAAQMAYYAQQEIAEIKTSLSKMKKEEADEEIVILREE